MLVVFTLGIVVEAVRLGLVDLGKQARAEAALQRHDTSERPGIAVDTDDGEKGSDFEEEAGSQGPFPPQPPLGLGVGDDQASCMDALCVPQSQLHVS